MPYDEFLKWQQYFEANPIGWREDDRTLKLLQVQGFKGEPSSVFTSFARLKKKSDAESLKASAMFKMMQSSVGGDALSTFVKDL